MISDLNTKRKKYLILTFIFQLSVAISGLVIGMLVKESKLGIPVSVYFIFHMILLLGLHYFAVYTTCLYFKKTSSKILYGVLVFGALILNFIAESPTIKELPISKTLFMASTFSFVISMIIWFVVIVRDIFLEAHNLTYRILGAANIYWLLVVIFAYFYTLFELFVPGSFGMASNMQLDTITQSFKLSLHTMVSIDHHYQLDLALENFTLIQATISHLFIVFLVGRLLTK